MIKLWFVSCLVLIISTNLKAACQDESADGFFQVGGVEVYFEDRLPDTGFDGLPEYYRCYEGGPLLSVDIGTSQEVCDGSFV